MRWRQGLALGMALASATAAAAATKEADLPDKEMLRMLEFLKDMEMIKQLDMLQDLQRIDSDGPQAKNLKAAKPAPQKGSVK